MRLFDKEKELMIEKEVNDMPIDELLKEADKINDYNYFFYIPEYRVRLQITKLLGKRRLEWSESDLKLIEEKIEEYMSHFKKLERMQSQYKAFLNSKEGSKEQNNE